MSDQPSNAVYHKRDCVWADKAMRLLDKHDVPFEEHVFSSRAEEQAFKSEHGVSTTPQVFLDGERAGGYEELAERFDEEVEEERETSYVPVIAIFATTVLLALATRTGFMGFMGFSLAVLACLKLMDIEGFVRRFAKYDLITRRLPAYGRVYPFAELFAGLGFLSGVLPLATGLVALFVGAAGGISIVKAVYIDKRELKCACVGGTSRVPLGFISLTENLMMVAMALWMGGRALM